MPTAADAMLDAFSKAAAWDPMGVAADEPSSYADRLKAELKTLRAGVRAVVEGAQGIPTTRADDASSLLACLREVMQEQRDEMETMQRDAKNLQTTISMLQEERRRYSVQPSPGASSPAPPAAAQPPPPPTAPPASAPSPTRKTTPAAEAPQVSRTTSMGAEAPPAELAAAAAAAQAAAIEEAVAEAVAEVRREERAHAAEALSAAEASHAARLSAALQTERADARTRATSHAQRLERAAQAERGAACATLATTVEELENGLRLQAEAHAKQTKQTRQRAAVMLAKQEAALASARQLAKAPPAPRVEVASCSVGVGTDDDDFGGNGGSSGFMSASEIAHALESSADTLASRFARRVADLEALVASLRATNRELEQGHSEDEKRKQALRQRLARQAKAAGGADAEYLRNVLLRWFCLPASERPALWPPIAAACAFTRAELDQIEAASKAHAASSSAGSWLFGRRDDTDRFADGPPGTPLATPRHPPPRTPATNTTEATPRGADDEAAALRKKVEKLRWLLWQANQEIQKLKRLAPDAPGA